MTQSGLERTRARSSVHVDVRSQRATRFKRRKQRLTGAAGQGRGIIAGPWGRGREATKKAGAIKNGSAGRRRGRETLFRSPGRATTGEKARRAGSRRGVLGAFWSARRSTVFAEPNPCPVGDAVAQPHAYRRAATTLTSPSPDWQNGQIMKLHQHRTPAVERK